MLGVDKRGWYMDTIQQKKTELPDKSPQREKVSGQQGRLKRCQLDLAAWFHDCRSGKWL